MGIAEVIPGVSGGTIAFVAGIYQQLIDTIDNIRLGLFSLRTDGLKGLFNRIDFGFLLSLAIGMVSGIVIGVLGVTHLLETYPPIIWAFFFGLIIGSCIYMLRKINLNLTNFIIVGFGAVLAFVLGTYSFGGGSTAWWFIMLCGMIAITALVLPGISGSFMLLMLGMYTFIIKDTVKGILVDFSMDKVMNLGIFAVGCIIGLFSIAKFLQWSLRKYYHPTLAVLIGFMIGSLQKIWPWRNPITFLDKSSGDVVFSIEGIEEYKVLSEALVLPSQYDLGNAYVLLSTLAALLGIGLIGLFARFESSAQSS